MDDIIIKVTNLKKGWGIRLFYRDGSLYHERFVRSRIEIGPACRSLMRDYDKFGPSDSKYAYKSRHRQGIKESRKRNIND